MAQYENLKSLAPAQEDGNGETEQKATAPKARRGRKKQSDDTAITKSEGHKLANQQQSETAELLGGLDNQERALTALLSYQEGQDYGKLKLAARTAGMTDVLVGASLDRIDALKEALGNNLKNHNPLAVLEDLGLSRSKEETDELRENFKGFNPDEYNRFLF
jgi:hypothetical protein